jgi:hypothetical protein
MGSGDLRIDRDGGLDLTDSIGVLAALGKDYPEKVQTVEMSRIGLKNAPVEILSFCQAGRLVERQCGAEKLTDIGPLHDGY